MCGRLNVTDNPSVIALCRQLGLDFNHSNHNLITSRFIRATDHISIIRKHDNQVRMDEAIWWLLLDKTDIGFKPSKYTSFNTRYDKLNIPRSAGYIPFRESRCIIPAAGFGETEYVNIKPIHYYDFEAVEGETIAFGGLYKEWWHPNTGEIVLSCSVITLPPHRKLSHIHSKAMPLMLPQNDATMDSWLDNQIRNVEIFNDLLRPNIPQDLITYPIDRPSLFNKVGESSKIIKDLSIKNA